MRRLVLLVTAAAFMVAPLLASTAASAASADPATAAPALTLAQQSCINTAVAGGTSPSNAIDNCLGSAGWSAAQVALANPSCSQAVQDPFTLNGLTLEWGTIMVCDRNVETMVFTGAAETSGGVVIDAKAGIGQPLGSYIQLWTNITACPLPGSYRSVITSATAVTTSGGSQTLLLATGRNAYVNCIG